MKTEYQIERANNMVRLRAMGVTYSEMSRDFNLSVGRVRQIVETRKARILKEQKMRDAQKELENVKTLDDFYNIKIELLDNRGRISSRLRFNGVTTILHTFEKTDDELLRIEGFGKKSLKDLRSLISKAMDDYDFKSLASRCDKKSNEKATK